MRLLLRSIVFIVALTGISNTIQASVVDGSSIRNMSQSKKAQFRHYLTTKRCDCGCNLTVARCLRTMKKCKHAPRMAKTKLIQLIGYQNRNSFKNPIRNPIRKSRRQPAGRLNRALFGVWERRTNRYVYLSQKYSFLRNGSVTYGTASALINVPGIVIKPGTRGRITHVGRWRVSGNMLYMKWTDGSSGKYKYSIFDHYGRPALSLNGTFYKFYSR
ncbi:hypothetical protein MNBD_GAMMA12-2963 [hydrothermal vent metagenome]|uniref:Uncharacterized protein n=1 Tax=hydrothermal vent metagenome TaxID=652676 RepID=A0A3B0YTV9_9ZZZZ